MYAYEPWSNTYTVNSPIWTSAHTTQFTQPGWRYANVAEGGGSGYLASGGSYVTLLSPSPNATTGLYDFTVVVEKLQGPCLRCAGPSTSAEVVAFQLAPSLLPRESLSFWSTNETHTFVQLNDIDVSEDGAFSFTAEPDTIYTVSTLTGQRKGQAETPIPPSAPFPFPYNDSFNNYSIDSEAHYFADDGGSFLIAAAPEGPDQDLHGNVLQQFVINQAGVNAWVPDTPPITIMFVKS